MSAFTTSETSSGPSAAGFESRRRQQVADLRIVHHRAQLAGDPGDDVGWGARGRKQRDPGDDVDVGPGLTRRWNVRLQPAALAAGQHERPDRMRLKVRKDRTAIHDQDRYP